MGKKNSDTHGDVNYELVIPEPQGDLFCFILLSHI